MILNKQAHSCWIHLSLEYTTDVRHSFVIRWKPIDFNFWEAKIEA